MVSGIDYWMDGWMDEQREVGDEEEENTQLVRCDGHKEPDKGRGVSSEGKLHAAH